MNGRRKINLENQRFSAAIKRMNSFLHAKYDINCISYSFIVYVTHEEREKSVELSSLTIIL